MTRRYVVRTGGKRHGFWYFSTFVNAQPYMTSDRSRCAAFQHRETAENVAKRCEEHTGRAWTVVDVTPKQEA